MIPNGTSAAVANAAVLRPTVAAVTPSSVPTVASTAAAADDLHNLREHILAAMPNWRAEMLRLYEAGGYDAILAINPRLDRTRVAVEVLEATKEFGLRLAAFMEAVEAAAPAAAPKSIASIHTPAALGAPQPRLSGRDLRERFNRNRRDNLLTPAEAARVMGTDKRHLMKMVRKNGLPVVHVPHRRGKPVLRFDGPTLHRWREKRQTAAAVGAV